MTPDVARATTGRVGDAAHPGVHAHPGRSTPLDAPPSAALDIRCHATSGQGAREHDVPARYGPDPGVVFALFGAHGGCGLSTVTALLDPQGSGDAVEVAAGQLVSSQWMPVVVTRSTAYGTASACDLVALWPTDVMRPWIVVVPDGPLRPPATARFYLRVMRDRTSGIAYVPYLPQLRDVVSVADLPGDRAVIRAGQALLRRISRPVAP